MIFYHNTEIFSTLIGRALWPMRVQILWKRRRDCGAIGFSLSRARDFPGLQRKWTQKTLTVIGEKNNNKQTNKQINQQQFSMVYTLNDNRNDVKMFKLGRETTRLRLAVPLEFLTF